MIPRALIGSVIAKGAVTVERGRLRLFAKAIGLTDPVHHDVDAARAAGYPDLLVPPTYHFTLETDLPGRRAIADVLQVPPGRVLHGEQSFEWLGDAFAGQTLDVSTRITAIESKKGGLLEFVERQTTVAQADGRPLANLTGTVVVRHA